MPENSNGVPYPENKSNEISWKLGPRDFVLKNLKYIPWVIVCGAISYLLAYLKIRYSTPIYRVQSSMLIKNQGSNNKTDRFDALFMSPSTENLSNEIQILSSRPVLQRVLNDIHLTTRYYNIGKVRTSILYPKTPFRLGLISTGPYGNDFGLHITVINDQQFKIEKQTTIHEFGEILNIKGNRFTLLRDMNVGLNNFSSPVYYIANQSASVVVNDYLSSLKILQSSDQSTILSLSFETENPELGVDFLNALMLVYDSLNIEDKNRIAINSLNFINRNLDTLDFQLNEMEGRVRNFRVSNEMFNADDQSRIYFNSAESGQTNIDAMDVKITVANLLQQYVSDPKKKHELVPIMMGIEEPAQFKNHYRK